MLSYWKLSHCENFCAGQGDQGQSTKVLRPNNNYTEVTLSTFELEIMKLDAEQYAGHKFTLRYMTNGYYDIRRTDTGFQIVYERFETPTEMSFDDYMFNEWLEDY